MALWATVPRAVGTVHSKRSRADSTWCASQPWMVVSACLLTHRGSAEVRWWVTGPSASSISSRSSSASPAGNVGDTSGRPRSAMTACCAGL